MNDRLLERGLPSNTEAERSILGAILLDNALCNQAIELMKRDDFFLDSHRRIFDKMVGLSERAMPIDLITLGNELRRAGEFEQIGGATYIASLIDGVPRTDTIEPYARMVKNKAVLRRLITASNQIIASAFDEEDDTDVIVDNAERVMSQISSERARHDDATQLYTLSSLLTTDIDESEAIIAAAHRAEVAALIAVTNVGKSTLLYNVALRCSREVTQ
jgi:replicative DNA helicase